MLPHGPLAHGKLGDYMLENSDVRFVVQDANQRDLYSVGAFGGNIIDAVRVADPNRDNFLEVQPMLNIETVINADLDRDRERRSGRHRRDHPDLRARRSARLREPVRPDPALRAHAQLPARRRRQRSADRGLHRVPARAPEELRRDGDHRREHGRGAAQALRRRLDERRRRARAVVRAGRGLRRGALRRAPEPLVRRLRRGAGDRLLLRVDSDARGPGARRTSSRNRTSSTRPA